MTILRYQQKPDVHVRQMEGQVFLADPDTDVLFHLDPIGSAVWRLLEQPTPMNDIIALLSDAFPDAEESRIETDVSALFNQLIDNGLINGSEE